MSSPGHASRRWGREAHPFGRKARVGAAVLALAAASGAVALGSCKSARQQARTFERCSRTRPCRPPNVCLKTESPTEAGICVHPCQRRDQCPEGFLCTGRYRLQGDRGRFCRLARVGLGQDCSRLRDGCREGLRCFKGRCRLACINDGHCPDPRRRCLRILGNPPRQGAAVTAVTPRRGTLAERVCLQATHVQGEPCSVSGPFCARGHVCQAGRCLRACRSDADCGDDQICDGALYTGAMAKRRAAEGARPDRLYCRMAGDRDAPCDLSRDRSCARGLYCLGARCRRIRHAPVGRPCRELRGILCTRGAVCHAGRCRKRCKTKADCPWRRGRQIECRTREVDGEPTRLCL